MPQDDKDSISDDIAAAYTELAGKDSPDTTETPGTAAPVAPVERTGEAAPTDAPTDKTQPEAPETPVEAPVLRSGSEPVEAPQHWPAADREMFGKQTPEAKSWLLKRHQSLEADYTRKMEGVAPARRLQEGIREIFAPHAQAMRLQGIDEIAAIKQLAAAHDYLQEKPNEAIFWLADKYGIDLKAVIAGGGEAQPDPRYSALEQKFTQLDKTLRVEAQRREQEQFQASLSQVQQFADEKDSKGQLAHPFFDEVTAEVSDLLAAARGRGKPITIQEAYTRAVRANDSTYAKWRAADEATRKAKEESERKAKADAARRAASGEVRGEGAASPGAATGKDNLRDELSANYDKLAGHARV